MSHAETPSTTPQRESVEACLRALTFCHQSFSETHHRDSARSPAPSSTEGTPNIVARFAEAATASLTPAELSQLVSFLEHAPLQSKTAKLRTDDLERSLQSHLHEFREQEAEVSGETEDRLAQPGGPADADLGLILHIQSEDEEIGAFWDARSATISLVQQKGLAESFVFGFDWHWRADWSFRGVSGCPASKWKPGLRNLHDNFSAQVLETLPLPFLVTGSTCCRDRLRRTLSSGARPIKIVLVPPIGVLHLDIDFHQDGVRRIIAHVRHPVAGFFVKPATRIAMAAQIDAGLDLMLWLIGRNSKQDFFAQQYSSPRSLRSRQNAPLAEMWAYVREEQDGQLLKLTEYRPDFLRWASRYLGENAADIVSRGESVAGNAALQIRKKMSLARRNRPNNQSRKRGSFGDFLSSKLTETSIPVPNDELIDPEQVKAFFEEFRQLSHTQPCAMEDLDGSIVTITSSGRVSIGSKEANVLRFRMGEVAAQDILESAKDVRVHLAGRSLQLMDNGRVLYTKPYERLLTSDQGAEWLVQIIHQQSLARNQVCEKSRSSSSKEPQPLTVIPHNASLGAHWKNPELRNRLLHGDIFNCTRSLHNGSPSYRVYFRGITFYIPQEADPYTVFIQCFLAPPGSTYHSKCIEGGKSDDPAQRLGVQLSYVDAVSKERKQQWLRQQGDKNVCKVNSLVDFLEKKPLEWTENEPRRFLDRNTARGRLRTAYTS